MGRGKGKNGRGHKGQPGPGALEETGVGSRRSKQGMSRQDFKKWRQNLRVEEDYIPTKPVVEKHRHEDSVLRDLMARAKQFSSANSSRTEQRKDQPGNSSQDVINLSSDDSDIIEEIPNTNPGHEKAKPLPPAGRRKPSSRMSRTSSSRSDHSRSNSRRSRSRSIRSSRSVRSRSRSVRSGSRSRSSSWSSRESDSTDSSSHDDVSAHSVGSRRRHFSKVLQKTCHMGF